MWIFSFLLLVAASSALGQLSNELKEDIDQCGEGLAALDLEELQEKSGEEQMETMCPELLDAFRCIDNLFKRELSLTLEEFTELVEGAIDDKVVKGLKVAVNTISMLTDLCTDGTQLNRDVKADMQCFESIDENDAAEECKEKAAIYNVFTDISNEIEEADDQFSADKACEEGAFMAACISVAVHEKCGERAFKTINTIIKRTTVFPNLVCSREDLEELKTSLVDTLDMPEAEKSLFKLALDLKRRRK